MSRRTGDGAAGVEGAGLVRDGAAGVRGSLDGGVRGIVLAAAGVTAFGLLAGAGARGPVLAGVGWAAAAPDFAGAGLGVAPVAPLSFAGAGCLAGADFFAGEDRDFGTEDLPGLTSCSSVHTRPALSITDGR